MSHHKTGDDIMSLSQHISHAAIIARLCPEEHQWISYPPHA